MRISHRVLEKARNNPNAFLDLYLDSQFQGRWGRLAYWKQGVKVFHLSGEHEAASYISDKYEEKFNPNPRELNRFISYLESYASSFRMLDNETISNNRRVNFNIGFGNILSGQVDRVDRNIKGGIEVYIYELNPDTKIESQLRFPVLKHFFAEEYSCSIDDVNVGIFDVDQGQHVLFDYSATDVKKALKELRVLSKLLSLN